MKSVDKATLETNILFINKAMAFFFDEKHDIRKINRAFQNVYYDEKLFPGLLAVRDLSNRTGIVLIENVGFENSVTVVLN